MKIIPSDKLKNKLEEMKIKKDDFHEGIIDIMYEEWENKDLTYKEILDWLEEDYGSFASFAVMIWKYNQQVCNGGHIQYFNNGYANGNGGFFTIQTPLAPLHKKLIKLFKQTELNDEYSKRVLDILIDFRIEQWDDEIINYKYLSTLNKRYYEINDEFMNIVNQYIKEKIIEEGK
jgi:hypothetical protein